MVTRSKAELFFFTLIKVESSPFPWVFYLLFDPFVNEGKRMGHPLIMRLPFLFLRRVKSEKGV